MRSCCGKRDSGQICASVAVVQAVGKDTKRQGLSPGLGVLRDMTVGKDPTTVTSGPANTVTHDRTRGKEEQQGIAKCPSKRRPQ